MSDKRGDRRFRRGVYNQHILGVPIKAIAEDSGFSIETIRLAIMAERHDRMVKQARDERRAFGETVERACGNCWWYCKDNCLFPIRLPMCVSMESARMDYVGEDDRASDCECWKRTAKQA